MKKEIYLYFNKNTSVEYDVNNRNYNWAFVNCTEERILKIIEVRGYIYLNQIYELFGIAWDINNDNPVIIDRNAKFHTKCVGGRFTIGLFVEH